MNVMSKRLPNTQKISRRTALGLAVGGSVAALAAGYGLPVHASPLADEIMKKIMSWKTQSIMGVILSSSSISSPPLFILIFALLCFGP